jgi:MFS transporter, Spinster family, sphingosine-1-phosphate transporter
VAQGIPLHTVKGAALFALGVLFLMNLLNYIDRYVFASVGPALTRDLKLSKYQFGVLVSSFMVVYTIVSPVVGWMGDRYSRKRLLAFGVGLWSVATVGTAFALNFKQMFIARSLLGVGEASYGVIAPALLADLFDVRLRGRVMGLFYLALPIGGALGYGIGGWVGYHRGWQEAFLWVGAPGILVALAGLMIRDPGRGASEGSAPAGKSERPRMADYLLLFRTQSYFYNVAGMAAVTFVSGAYANYAPSFYNEVRGMQLKEANYWIGGLTAGAGLVGILIGMFLADYLLKFTRRAYLLWPAVAVATAIPFMLGGILIPDDRLSLYVLFVGMVLMGSVLGPCNTVTANVVPATQRAIGYAMSLFLMHLFGDISSPILIGWLSDHLGRPSVAGSFLGKILANVGASPVVSPSGKSENLAAGMLLMIPMLAIGSLFFLLGSRHLAQDEEHARRHSPPGPNDAVRLH